MKKLFYVLFIAFAVLAASCSKEIGYDETASEANLTGETITFTASIDVPAATKAALSSLNINWSSGDYIGFATDNDATIRAYEVAVDGEDPTKCTVEVSKVAGATAYYAIFRGSNATYAANDFTGITFDTESKTFSGLTVGQTQCSAGEFNSHLYISNGYPLTMAGKASGTSLAMKPCLALFKMRIASASVPADYYYKTITYNSSYDIDHSHDYSAVRGFNFYQNGASPIYSSGDFTVQIAADGSLTTSVVDNENKKIYRQLSLSTKMASGTDYYMCLIPGGSTTSFKFDFLGFTDANDGTIAWTTAYSMSLKGNRTVYPGDYYDLGELNPLGRKKAANEAADEAEDALASVPFTPAISIDGSFDDWDPTKNSKIVGKVVSSTGGSHYQILKVAYDERFVYLYTKRDWSSSYDIWSTSSYIYYGFDLDNNSDTPATTLGEMSGADATLLINPFSGSINAPELSLSSTKLNGSTYSFDGLLIDGTITTESTQTGYVEFEMRVKRSDIKNGSMILEDGNTINVYTWGNKSASELKSTATTITISD